MDKLSMLEFTDGFAKQLAYGNRTFLRGHYNYRSGAEKFTVTKCGHVWEFETLEEAIKKYNEVIDEQIP